MFASRKKVFVVLVAIVVIAVVGWSLTQSKHPGSVRFFIDRSVIKHGKNATITVAVENFDLKTHVVEYRFNVSHRLLIYEGAENLLPRNDSECVFTYTLEASIPSEERVFVVVGTLEEGVLSATYPISLAVYFDGNELEKTWSDLTLTVER